MESASEIANKKQVIMNHVADQIEVLTKSSMEQLVAEFQLMVAKWVKDKDLPAEWAGNAAPEAMMRTALYQSAHTEGLKMIMGNDVINKIYEEVTNPKTTKKAAGK